MNVSTKFVDTMKEDKDDLDMLMDELWSMKNNISLLQGEDVEICGQVGEMERVVCNLKRDIHKCLKETQPTTKPLDLHNYSTPFIQVCHLL